MVNGLFIAHYFIYLCVCLLSYAMCMDTLLYICTYVHEDMSTHVQPGKRMHF